MTPRGLAFFVVLALALATAPARGDPVSPESTIFVVTFDSAATGLDAGNLRSAIGKELGATAVPPGDPRARQARGTIAISVDRRAHALVVSYREDGDRITRAVDLPPSPDATARAAVLLAGNLARDEAGELAAELRRRAPAPEEHPVAAPTAATPPKETVEEETDPDEAAARRDLDRMHQTLSRYAGSHRTALFVVGAAAIGLAEAAQGTAIYLAGQRNERGTPTYGSLPLVLQGFWGPLLVTGIWTVVQPLTLKPVEDYYSRDLATGRPATLVREDVEARWRRAARTEESLRHVGGGVLAVGGAGAAIVFTVLATQADQGSLNHAAVMGDASLAVAGVVEMGIGLLFFFNDGPVAAALHAYERASGREVPTGSAPEVGLRVIPATGGGALGIGGTF